MSANRIYVACLASYNNGVLHGAWIDASTDVAEMQEQINSMLRASQFPNVTVKLVEEYRITESVLCRHNSVNALYMSEVDNHPGILVDQVYPQFITGTPQQVPSAEEWAIHDHEGEALDGLCEYTGLADVARRVEVEELAEAELGADGPEIVRAYWDYVGSVPGNATEAVEEVRDVYAGSFATWTEWAEDFCHSTGLLDGIPENLRYYFDFEAYGRDARLNGDLFENDGHFFYAQ